MIVVTQFRQMQSPLDAVSIASMKGNHYSMLSQILKHANLERIVCFIQIYLIVNVDFHQITGAEICDFLTQYGLKEGKEQGYCYCHYRLGFSQNALLSIVPCLALKTGSLQTCSTGQCGLLPLTPLFRGRLDFSSCMYHMKCEVGCLEEESSE